MIEEEEDSAILAMKRMNPRGYLRSFVNNDIRVDGRSLGESRNLGQINS